MNRVDEEIRGVVNDGLTEAGVDVRNLAIEVDGGVVIIAGTVPDSEQRQRVQALARFIQPAFGDVTCRIDVVPVPPTDSADGRGRSPLTGTSSDSAHESRHQRDVE